MGKYLIERPMLLSGIGCVLVSLLSFYSKGALSVLLFVAPIILSVLIFKKADKRLVAVLVLIFIMTVSSFITLRKAENLGYHNGTKFDAVFTVCEVDYKSDGFYVSTVETVKSDRLSRGTRIRAYLDPLALKSGQRIKATISIIKTSDTYKRDNYSNATYLTGSLSNIEVLKETDFVLSFGEKIRNYITKILSKYTDYDVKATLCALLFGDKDYFTREFYTSVRASGVSHVMVVSGMHLSIILSFLMFIFERIYYSKYVKFLTIMAIVMVMWVLCGFTMSILRAGVTYIFMAIGLLFDKKGKPENTLGTALTAILIFSPFSIFSLSLQLSLLSTFGILVVAVPMMSFIRFRNIIENKKWIWVVNACFLSVSAFVFTLPIVIYNFEGISVVGIFTSLLISLPVTAAIIICVLALILSLIFEPLSYPLFYLASMITKYINFMILGLGKSPFSMVSVPKHFYILAGVIILFIICILLACKKRINMLKLKEINQKIIKEGGGKFKWR